MSSENKNWNHLLSHPNVKLKVGKAEIEVWDGVFNPDPAQTYSTSIILDNLPDIVGKRVIDLGTGSGVLAINLALLGASQVLALDREPKATENAAYNIKINGVQDVVEVRQSNLLENVTGQWDYIFANLPISETLWKDEPLQLVAKTLEQARRILTADGKLYLAWADFGGKDELERLLKNTGVHEVRSLNQLGHEWYLYIVL